MPSPQAAKQEQPISKGQTSPFEHFTAIPLSSLGFLKKMESWMLFALLSATASIAFAIRGFYLNRRIRRKG